MINIVINNNEYCVPVSWSEVTLSQAIELQNDLQRRPAYLREYFASQFEPSAHEPSTNACCAPELLDMLICSVHIICKIPVGELRKTDPRQIEDFVTKYLSHFIVSLIFEPVFTPQNITQFEWNSQVLLLPKSESDVLQELMPFTDVSAEQLCLATDLHVQGSLRYAATIVAILCLPEGEKPSMRTALRRAEKMEELPMSIVFEVFFCFRKHMNI